MRFLCLLLPLLLITPAYAQESLPDANSDRIDQLEQDILLLKRQLDRARVSGQAVAPESGGETGNIGDAQVNLRISALEEEIKSLRGQLEEKDFEYRRLSEEMEKFKRDSEFRLTEIENAARAATPAPAPAAAPAEPEQPAAIERTLKKKTELSEKEISVKDAADVPAEVPPTPAGDTPRDHYNYAFRLLNQNQYDEAAKSFADFVKKFPKDPLVGNAYYWQGETYYIRKDYAKSAEHFRQGFEALPQGPKAADNLLKLGMSLSALKKQKEACIVLAQVMDKFKTSSANVAAKAAAEHKRNGCE
ncbi:MAG: tol-pal system protein YbgF [Alphaproteobacteria bacterium]|nr:tol-pal system protein YbgF [Alphaproteobacteria bacterium]